MAQMIIDRRNTELEYSTDCIIVRTQNEAVRTTPLQHISQLICMHNVRLSTQLIGQLKKRGIDLISAAKLLEQRQFKLQQNTLLQGGMANITEKRAAWHSLLRAPAPSAEVMAERERLNAFIRETDTARRWRNIVHIGIGGSDWGVRLSVGAFGYTKLWRNVRFIANIDGHAVEAGLAGLNPHDTLIVVAPKSFTTAETLENAARALE